MASLPPISLPPVQAPPPNAPPPPVIVPTQVVAADLTNQLLRELTIPVTAVTVAQTPVSPQPTPSPAQLILNAATPPQQAAPQPAPILLQLQTPQGTVQLALPATALPQQQQPGLAIPLPANLTAPQWQQLVDQGHVQLQIAPVPAALLQRLAPGTPPLLAQLILQPRDLARLLGTPLQGSVTTAAPGLIQPNIGIGVGTAPSSYTATILPPALAESYKARFATAADVILQTAASAPRPSGQNNVLQTAASAPRPSGQNNVLQNTVTSIRNWFDAIKPTVAFQPAALQGSTLRVEPSLTGTAQPPSIDLQPDLKGRPASLPSVQSPAPTTQLRQVAISLVTVPQPSIPAPAAAATPSIISTPIETSARLLGLTPSGEKLLELVDGQVLLAPSALPLTLGKPATLRLAPLGDTVITLQPEHALTLARTQPAINEALETLNAAAPALAQRLASQILLQPLGQFGAQPGGLAPSLLFLMAAVGLNPSPVKTGTAPSLSPTLREALDKIDGARPAALGTTPPIPLAERLLSELRQLGEGRMVLDDTGQPWRGFTLPSQLGETLQTPINFYVQQQPQQRADHHQRDDAPAPAGTVKQTRFIVDMQLSRLGTTQLEGLSRARQLDLTLRTHTAFPLALQSELTARYAEIASATGLVGTLQFGAGRWFTARETSGAPQVNARL